MMPAASRDAGGVALMTIVDDNYTGHVEPGTAARRTLPGVSIVKRRWAQWTTTPTW